jgi:hypothetical protein
MRLGKEKAAGYVEDLEAEPTGTDEVTIDSAERTPLTPAPEPVAVAG